MDKRVVDWIDTNGRRLIELQIKGGDEYFKTNKCARRLDGLNGNDWIEFFTLLGQLDGLMYALSPEDPVKASSFRRSIKRRLKKLERYCSDIYELTGSVEIAKTEA